jgi:hypothetical protein
MGDQQHRAGRASYDAARPRPRPQVAPKDDRAFLVGASVLVGMAIANIALLTQRHLWPHPTSTALTAIPVLGFALLPLVGGMVRPARRVQFTWMSWSVSVAYAVPFWSGAPQSVVASFVLLLTAIVANGPTKRLRRRHDEAKILLDPASPATIVTSSVALGGAVATVYADAMTQGGAGIGALAAVGPAALLLLLSASKRRYGALLGLLGTSSLVAYGSAVHLATVPLTFEVITLVVTCALLRATEVRDIRSAYPVRYAGLDRITIICFCTALAAATTVISLRLAHDNVPSSTSATMLLAISCAASIPALRTARRLRSILLAGLAAQFACMTAALHASLPEQVAIILPMTLAALFHSDLLRSSAARPSASVPVPTAPPERQPLDRRPITEIPLARGA